MVTFTPADKLESPGNLICTYLECGRKMEYSKETLRLTGSKPGPSSWEVTVVSTEVFRIEIFAVFLNTMFYHWPHAQLSHLRHYSHFLYPSKSWRSGDSGGDDASSSGDGKYELLSVANNIIAEEIRNVMSKSQYKSIFIWVKFT